jgi:glycosyltransferase involved in cell wall biosynthesis
VRVLFAINSLGSGGTERSVAELVAPLRARDIEISFACLESHPGVEDTVRRAGSQVAVLRTRSPRAVIPALHGMIRELKPDLVHTALFESDVFARIAAVGTGVPVMGSLVNTGYEPERLIDPNVSRSGLEAARLVDGWTGRHLSDHFHAVSHAVKASAERRLGFDSRRITVVERGRDVERLGQATRQRRLRVRDELEVDDSCQLLLSVGRQEYQKDHLCLIEAIGRLVERKDLLALIAGRAGNATPDLTSALSSSPGGNRIRLLGHRDDIPDLLAAADLFVCTSRFEGLPGAIIEAMALGLPVVATSIAPVREVVEPGANAEIFDPGDSDALAAIVRELLDQPGRRSDMGARSREIFLARFTLERSADLMADLYREVAARGRQRSRSSK